MLLTSLFSLSLPSSREKEAAIQSLKIVVEISLKISRLRGCSRHCPPPSSKRAEADKQTDQAAESVRELPQIDLVGNWRATKGDAIIDLAISEILALLGSRHPLGNRTQSFKEPSPRLLMVSYWKPIPAGPLPEKFSRATTEHGPIYPPAASSEDGLVFKRVD